MILILFFCIKLISELSDILLRFVSIYFFIIFSISKISLSLKRRLSLSKIFFIETASSSKKNRNFLIKNKFSINIEKNINFSSKYFIKF